MFRDELTLEHTKLDALMVAAIETIQTKYAWRDRELARVSNYAFRHAIKRLEDRGFVSVTSALVAGVKIHYVELKGGALAAAERYRQAADRQRLYTEAALF